MYGRGPLQGAREKVASTYVGGGRGDQNQSHVSQDLSQHVTNE